MAALALAGCTSCSIAGRPSLGAAFASMLGAGRRPSAGCRQHMPHQRTPMRVRSSYRFALAREPLNAAAAQRAGAGWRAAVRSVAGRSSSAAVASSSGRDARRWARASPAFGASSVHVRMCTCHVHVHAHTCLQVRACACKCACVGVHGHACMCMCACACLHACLCVWACTCLAVTPSCTR